MRSIKRANPRCPRCCKAVKGGQCERCGWVPGRANLSRCEFRSRAGAFDKRKAEGDAMMHRILHGTQPVSMTKKRRTKKTSLFGRALNLFRKGGQR